ncbi:unnamed protein product [Mytilus coruscus]|uniref:C2H2-type domain-containing protein n=1 Tax=Mytilus coruscus TaxID=42192 RepID=A0A6J8DSH6_MYTCO|nr:unnamed protein product [Mytilus coruscus]
MANTKKTPRARWRCPVCQVRFNTEKELEDHVLACVKKRSSEEEYLCDLCPYATSRKSDFTRHQRRRHAASLSAIDDTNSEWEKQNPGTLSDVLGEPSKSKTCTTSTSMMATGSLIKGRVVRKSTSPLPVANPSRKRLLDTLNSSLGPQPIASKRFVLPRLPTTTATIVPSVSSSFLIPRVVDTDSDESSKSNPSPLLFSSSPMDVGNVTTTTTGTIPTHVPAQVVRPVTTFGLMLVERRVVRRYKENAAEEAVASERSIGCIQGKAFPDGEALNTNKVVTQTKQSNTRTGPDKVNIKQLPQVKHWPKSSRYKAVATSKALAQYIVNNPLLLESTS